jgi:hypothetical protein
LSILWQSIKELNANYTALTRRIVLLTLRFEADGGRGESGTDSDFSIWASNFLTSSSNLAFSFWSSTIICAASASFNFSGFSAVLELTS